jgi:hypothetical protein
LERKEKEELQRYRCFTEMPASVKKITNAASSDMPPVIDSEMARECERVREQEKE